MNRKKLYVFFSHPYLILFIVTFILHLFMRTDFGDDNNYFLTALENHGYIDFLVMRYESWSSRVVIEGVLVLIVAFPLLWKLLDSLVLVLLAWTISYLLGCQEKTREKCYICCLVLLYPMSNMSSAGWMATTLNYLWVAAFMFFAFTGAYNVFHQKKVSVLHKIALLLATLYASNQEQACACMCMLFVVFLVVTFLPQYKVLKGRGLLVAQLIISIGNLIFIALSPGNVARGRSELFYSLQSVNYGRYTLHEKIALGFQNSMMLSFSSTDLVLLLFLLILFIAVTYKWKGSLMGLGIFAIPLMIRLVYLSGSKMFEKLTYTMGNRFLVSNDNYMRKGPYVVIIFWAAILLILVLSLLIISKDLMEFLYLLLVLGTGLGSSMIMGFSPTYAYSGRRTFIFFYFSLIYMSVYIVLKHWEFSEIQSSGYGKYFRRGSELVLGMMTAVSVLEQWVYVCFL